VKRWRDQEEKEKKPIIQNWRAIIPLLFEESDDEKSYIYTHNAG
jgi:hypothetical protein